MKMQPSFLKKIIQPKALLTIFSIIYIFINIFYFCVFTYRQKVKSIVWLEPGYQFRTFKKFIQGEETIGYITDKNLSRENNDGIYLQAQYYLAPVYIDLKNTKKYRYNIVDSENILFLKKTFKANHFKRLTNNEYGQALVRRER